MCCMYVQARHKKYDGVIVYGWAVFQELSIQVSKSAIMIVQTVEACIAAD